MLKTCIQLVSITRVRSLQLCSMHATLAVQPKRASNEQQRNRRIPRQVVPSNREIAGPVSNSQPSVVKASKDEISMIRECDEKLPWQGLKLCQTFCTKRKSKLEKESTFLQTVWQPQTSAQYPASLMQKTKLPTTIQTVMKKFVRLKILRRRVLGFTYSYNLQRFVLPFGEGQELGLTPVSPGTYRSKFLQFV